jgi:predicted DNA-binding ribbon-helix-helix protein
MAPDVDTVRPIERVQLGVRMEKNLVKVLKGLAAFEEMTFGELLEKIVLHTFEPVVGDEGESCASPHGRRALAAIADLKRVYGVDYTAHDRRSFTRDADL